MGKSVYSIVLSDEVVEAVDEMAYTLGTSRSNLINQILAEKVSFMTPEMRMKQIFEQMQRMMGSKLQIFSQPSDSIICIKSPLKYKYKPTIRYTLELPNNFSSQMGRLRVQCRTKSVELINAMDIYFEKWKQMEEEFLGEVYPEGVPCAVENGKFIRDFYSISVASANDIQIASAVSDYIQLLDESIKMYFASINSGENWENKIRQNYEYYLDKNIKIL